MSSDPSCSTAIVEACLGRHATRRAALLPTVSTLVGPRGLAIAAWQRWASAASVPAIVLHLDSSKTVKQFHNLRVAGELARRPGESASKLAGYTGSEFDSHSIIADLLGVLSSLHNLPELALRHLHAAAGLPPPSPAHLAMPRTQRNLDQLLAAAEANSPDDPAVTRGVAHVLCDARRPEDLRTALDALEASCLPEMGRSGWRALRAVDAILPPGGRPAVLFAPACDEGQTGLWMNTIAESIFQLTETLPRWPVGASFTSGAMDRFRRNAAPSRAKSFLLTGELPIPVLDPPALAQRLRAVVAEEKECDQAARGIAAAERLGGFGRRLCEGGSSKAPCR